MPVASILQRLNRLCYVRGLVVLRLTGPAIPLLGSISSACTRAKCCLGVHSRSLSDGIVAYGSECCLTLPPQLVRVTAAVLMGVFPLKASAKCIELTISGKRHHGERAWRYAVYQWKISGQKAA